MKAEKKYAGVVVPMMTPFDNKLAVDVLAVRKLVNHVIAHGAHPFVLGTTGEAPSIAKKERGMVVDEAVEVSAGKAKVYAGISGNSFADVVAEGNAYAALGVNALVSTMPSYYPVDDEQIFQYFTRLADALQAPLIIYNIPATTHLSIPIAVAERLSSHPNIVGFKDSEKGTERITEATKLWKDREDFCYLLGWALMSKPALEQGADGIIPSSGNIAPAVYKKLYDAIKTGDEALAKAAQQKGEDISAAYQQGRILSHSLSAFKAMLAAYGLCGPDVLPPLLRLENEKAYQQSIIEKFGTIDSINSI